MMPKRVRTERDKELAKLRRPRYKATERAYEKRYKQRRKYLRYLREEANAQRQRRGSECQETHTGCRQDRVWKDNADMDLARP